MQAVAQAMPVPERSLAERRSGYEQMGRETRAMQDDDAANPATFWVLDGEAASSLRSRLMLRSGRAASRSTSGQTQIR